MKSPVQEVAWTFCVDREIPGPHIEKMQRMMAAERYATPKRRARLDDRQAEGLIEPLEAGNGRSGASETAADDADIELFLPHRPLLDDLFPSLGCYHAFRGKKGPPRRAATTGFSGTRSQLSPVGEAGTRGLVLPVDLGACAEALYLCAVVEVGAVQEPAANVGFAVLELEARMVV